MHECDFVNRQELQTQLLQFHFSLQPTLQLDSKDSSKRGSPSNPKVKFWPVFGDFHCFFLLQVVKFTHWLICLGWIERSQVREDGRINGEENGKWERRQVVAGGSINKLSLSLSVSVCLCLCICLFVGLRCWQYCSVKVGLNVEGWERAAPLGNLGWNRNVGKICGKTRGDYW